MVPQRSGIEHDPGRFGDRSAKAAREGHRRRLKKSHSGERPPPPDTIQPRGETIVAMESTVLYWRPVYAVLEGGFRLLLVNARHVKQVPDRKTDVRDCEWLAQLLECGLLRGSFVPPPEIRDLRDLTRFGRRSFRNRSSLVNRVAKILELANVAPGSVVSNIMSVNGPDDPRGHDRGGAADSRPCRSPIPLQADR